MMIKRLYMGVCLVMAAFIGGLVVTACPMRYGNFPGESIIQQTEKSSITIQLVGTATEKALPLEMNELIPKGEHTGVYEAYMKASEGEFLITAKREEDGRTITLGQGSKMWEVTEGGMPFRIDREEVVRVRLDTRKDSISILPVTLYVKGNIVENGTQMAYLGHGVWKSQVEMNHGDVFLFSDKYFYFAFNNDDALALKRIRGKRSELGMPSEGFDTENIRINRGTYIVTLDMSNRTWDIDAPIDDNRISAFGSSVCNGEGAEDHKGYAYMYGQVLAERYERGESLTPFTVSGVSIGGNTTQNLLNRYDEMLHDFGRYVIIGLSMGNEGIHGAENPTDIFCQFRDNMLKLIRKCREDGKIPVVMNNYTRADYTPIDYDYIKKMNLNIHRWEVPSVNVLGAIDNGEGKWADGYMRDPYHQDTKGHREFMYAIPPSLFDALKQEKPYPTRDTKKFMTLSHGATLQFAGEGMVHPYTVTIRIRGNRAGLLLTVLTQNGEASVSILEGGRISYVSTDAKRIDSPKPLLTSNSEAYDITLTHYYAQQRTLLYVGSQLVGELKDRMVPEQFIVGDAQSNVSRKYQEISFWRSAMTPEEITLHHQGVCMKSSLAIYTPLDDQMKQEGFTNRAQSLNSTMRFVPHTGEQSEITDL
ncbi:MAG: SGNH/GDSL hydrolase family protein [Bacteroidaceae bacterium]